MNKEKKQVVTPDNLKETAVMTIAVGIIAAAVYFFLIPSGVSVGSISGLAMLLGNVIPLPISVLTSLHSCLLYKSALSD